MKATIRFLAVLIAVVALSPHSYSQTMNKGMEGYTGVDIIVEDLDPDARTCGVTRSDIRSAASFPIASSRLRIDRDAPLTLYVRATVLEIPGGCAAGYGAQAYSFGQALGATQQSKILKLLFWHDTGVVTGTKSKFGRRVNESIEKIIKRFVVAWTLDQQ